MDAPVDHALMSLREVRRLLHYTAEELAKRLAISPTSYMRHERGERRIYFDKVLTIARTMGVPVDMFSRPLTVEERQRLVALGEPRRLFIERAKAKGLEPDSIDRLVIERRPTPAIPVPPEPELDERVPDHDEELAADPVLAKLAEDWGRDKD